MIDYLIAQAVCVVAVLATTALALRKYRAELSAVTDGLIARAGTTTAADGGADRPTDTPVSGEIAGQAKELLPLLLRLRRLRWRAEVDANGFRLVIANKGRRSSGPAEEVK